MHLKQKRLILLISYVFLACFAVYFIRPYYLFSILIVLCPPAVANFIWVKKAKKRIMLFSLLCLLLFAPPIELITRLANAWDVQSILPRPFGLLPLENMLFAFINLFWVLSFYEYFIKKKTDGSVSKKIIYLFIILLIFSILVYSLFFYNKNLIKMNYSIMAVPVLVIPSIFFFWKIVRANDYSPLRKMILPTLFFALVFFIYEMVSLQIGSWWWPGEYIYSFMINGHKFPLDDVIIWYFLSTPVLIGGYEYFIKD